MNTRGCDEIFGDAQSKLSRATAIGDFPVIFRDGDGKLIFFTFSNVRCVPGFKYALLSVKQLWAEQQVDCRWRDLGCYHWRVHSGQRGAEEHRPLEQQYWRLLYDAAQDQVVYTQ